MRYSVEHKEKSRERILVAARDLFRRRGFEGASIDQVMQAAGLTRGAFYAHFDSKDDLVRRVLDIEAGLVLSLQRAAEAEEPRVSALAALTRYLDSEGRADVATGCPLVAHPVDAIRGDVGRREGYTARLQALIDSVGVVLGDGGSLDDAILVSVLAVGGGLLSAASADTELGDRIADVCLDRIRSLVGSASAS